MLTVPDVASGHEVRPGYLELRARSPVLYDPVLYDVVWKKPARGELEIVLEPIFPVDCAVNTALADATAPGAVVWRGSLSCASGLDGRTLSIDGLPTTLTDVLVKVQHADGRIETHLLKNASPSVILGTASSRLARSATYARVGVEHILLGVDHLLFVLGLLLIVRNRWMLVSTITAFTVAHSITLAVATLGVANAPILPLNAAIALSILFLGPEIVRSWRGETSFTLRHPWIVAFVFGLLHGFGFASGLTSMGIAGHEIPWALLLFNVGVELGQLGFVLLILALERSFRVLELRWPRWVALLPAYLVGSLGAYWTFERTAVLLGLAR
jgi:hydrogenase/urease accessory protein HupE